MDKRGETRRPEPPRDPPESEGCSGDGGELTRTNSDASSVTVDAASNTSSSLGHYTAWTNEKHNSYLDSLEASFINQLHDSLDLHSRNSKRKSIDNSSYTSLDNAVYPSDQFAVLQGGAWRKKVFATDHILPNGVAVTRASIGSPWIRHFLCSNKQCNRELTNSTEHISFRVKGIPSRGEKISTQEPTTSHYPYMHHEDQQDTVGISGEGCGQNFVDEDKVGKVDSFCRENCMKVGVSASPEDEDQIVPCGSIY